MSKRLAVALLLACLAALPAAAADLGYEGWGMRVGSTSSPGRIVLGAEMNLGQLTDRLRFVPAVDLESGSDTTVLSLSLPVQFHVTDEGELRPYFGGGAVVSALDVENNLDDQNGVEVGAFVMLGFEMRRSRSGLFAEASLATGEAYTSKLVIGWRF